MRSCEYVKVSGDRKTNQIHICDVQFFKGTRELHHNSPAFSLGCLCYVDTVSVTFTLQKNQEKEDTVTMHRSSDPTFCPVCTCASIVIRLRTTSGTSDHTTVNAYHDSGRLNFVTAKQVSDAIKANILQMGQDRLGFTTDNIGIHSIRASTAMALNLGRIPIYVIVLVSRWSSDAFFNYIRKKVQDFTRGVSDAMLSTPKYVTIPTT